MTSAKDLITIVTPARNAGCFIGETIASARSQTHGDWEMIVVDDASTDDTVERVRAAAAADTRIRLVAFATNQGIAAARNAALERARGRFVAFLDSDDLWDVQKLQRQSDFMRERGAAFSFTAYRLVSERGELLGEIPCQARTITYREMLNGQRVGCLTVMLERTAVGKRKFPAFPKASDLALWLEILHAGYVAHGMPETLASYRVLPSSISRNKAKYVGNVWDVYRAQPISKSAAAWSYAQYAFRGAVKHFTSGAYRVKPA